MSGIKKYHDFIRNYKRIHNATHAQAIKAYQESKKNKPPQFIQSIEPIRSIKSIEPVTLYPAADYYDAYTCCDSLHKKIGKMNNAMLDYIANESQVIKKIDKKIDKTNYLLSDYLSRPLPQPIYQHAPLISQPAPAGPFQEQNLPPFAPPIPFAPPAPFLPPIPPSLQPFKISTKKSTKELIKQEPSGPSFEEQIAQRIKSGIKLKPKSERQLASEVIIKPLQQKEPLTKEQIKEQEEALIRQKVAEEFTQLFKTGPKLKKVKKESGSGLKKRVRFM